MICIFVFVFMYLYIWMCACLNICILVCLYLYLYMPAAIYRMITGSGMICIKLRLVGLGGGHPLGFTHTQYFCILWLSIFQNYCILVFTHTVIAFFNSIVFCYFCDIRTGAITTHKGLQCKLYTNSIFALISWRLISWRW